MTPELLVYIILIGIAFFIADNRGRQIIAFIVASMFIMPIIVIFLACIGKRYVKNCTSCMKEIKKEAVFCESCGEKQEDAFKCPFCVKEIKKDVALCKYCNGNVQEWKERKKRLQEFEENGIRALLDDEEFMKMANSMECVHGVGKINYINEEAKKRGFGDINLTEEDLNYLGYFE